MYLVSAYFDQKAEKIMQRFIEWIAGRTGNSFMTDNHVPPHLTISSVEARSAEALLSHAENLRGQLSQGAVYFVSAGVSFPGRYGHGKPAKSVNTALSALHSFQSYIISVFVYWQNGKNLMDK